MTDYKVSGIVTLPDNVKPWNGKYHIGIHSDTGIALDNDGSWRSGDEALPVDKSTGYAEITLPETTGGQMYSLRYEAFRGEIKGPWYFTLNSDRTWASIISNPTPIPGLSDQALNVKSFGARGDGVTDDTIALNAAAAALHGEPGALYFPPGTYINHAPITLLGNQTMFGAGARSSILKLKDGANVSLVVTPDDGVQRYGVEIRNMGFDGNGRNQTATDKPLISIHGVNEVSVTHCYSVGARGDWLRIGQDTPGIYCTIPQVHFNDVRGDYEGDVDETFGNGISLQSGSSDASLVSNDIGYFKNGAGILMAGHNGAMLTNNNCWQNRYGYFAFQSSRTRYVGCLSDYSQYYGFAVQESTDSQFAACQARESSQDVVNLYDGFWFEGTSGHKILNTVMVGCRSMGERARWGVRLNSYVDGIQLIGGDYTGVPGNLSGEVYDAGTGVVNVTRIDDTTDPSLALAQANAAVGLALIF